MRSIARSWPTMTFFTSKSSCSRVRASPGAAGGAPLPPAGVGMPAGGAARLGLGAALSMVLLGRG